MNKLTPLNTFALGEKKTSSGIKTKEEDISTYLFIDFCMGRSMMNEKSYNLSISLPCCKMQRKTTFTVGNVRHSLIPQKNFNNFPDGIQFVTALGDVQHANLQKLMSVWYL